MASRGDKGRNKKRQVNVDENSAVIKTFRGYQLALDTRHDRHERIVKLSRDITIESKRVIFLLQRCAGCEPEEQQGILQQALSKLKEIQQTRFLQVAAELDGQDHFQFMRAYSPGLQEYIEAVSFYHYLKDGSLITLSEVEKDLRFPRPPPTTLQTEGAAQQKNTAENAGAAVVVTVPVTDAASDSTTKESSSGGKENPGAGGGEVYVNVPPTEFMLGVADLTGELMRTAIMSVSAGDLDKPVRICQFMRIIHDAFMSYGNTARELTRKMSTLRQSLHKVENACYTLKVRGSEIPKHMWAGVFAAASVEGPFSEDMDESGVD